MGLDGVELIFAIEEEFGIEIADAEAENVFTVGDLFELVKTRVTPKGDSDEEIWSRFVRVMVHQLNLRPDKIKPEASLAKDLGID